MAPTSERRQPQPKRSGGGGPRRPAKSKNTGPKGPPPEELKPILDPPPIEKFTEWPLDERIQRAIANMDIVTPTPVQKLAIGPVLEGKDVIAKAETGTGKTLAFGAPMISKMDVERSTVLGLVLCPTRELAQQVARVLESLALEKGLNVGLLVGGDPIPPQIKQLQKGCQVVVGTPGRVLDLYKQRFLKFPWTEFVVLDEADEMLEIGFLDDVEKIISFTPEERQTLLFSATFPPALLSLARKHTQNPVEIATAKGVATVDRIQQSMAYVKEDDVAFVLRRLIQDSSKDDLFLVFGERRTDVDRLYRRLERLPEGVKALHGGFDQAARFRVMDAFRKSEVRALIATDVASRGLDVSGVTHVINVGLPREVSTYTHRIGRTGRAGKSGHALTLVTPMNRKRWRVLREQMNWEVTEIDDRDIKRVMFKKPNVPGQEPEADADERPRAPRRSREDGEREERPRRERGRREERSERPERGDRAERPRRDDDEPRRTRGRSRDGEPRGEARSADREERRPRTRSRSRDGEERPRRDREGRGERQERGREPGRDEERPARRDGGRRRREEGESKGYQRSDRDGERRQREDRGRRSGDDAPRRERGDRRNSDPRPPAKARSEAQPQPAGDDGQGFGAGLQEARPPRAKKREQAPREKRRPVQDAPQKAPENDSGSSFGAGL
ncbi:MAG: DEAD/DEAH box helicase [Planctomycetota bacterium]|jgi:superfamily II DNA/RNA helicase